jgi:hypothetical protein
LGKLSSSSKGQRREVIAKFNWRCWWGALMQNNPLRPWINILWSSLKISKCAQDILFALDIFKKKRKGKLNPDEKSPHTHQILVEYNFRIFFKSNHTV